MRWWRGDWLIDTLSTLLAVCIVFLQMKIIAKLTGIAL